jgi:hypothetical protein
LLETVRQGSGSRASFPIRKETFAYFLNDQPGLASDSRKRPKTRLTRAVMNLLEVFRTEEQHLKQHAVLTLSGGLVQPSMLLILKNGCCRVEISGWYRQWLCKPSAFRNFGTLRGWSWYGPALCDLG